MTCTVSGRPVALITLPRSQGAPPQVSSPSVSKTMMPGFDLESRAAAATFTAPTRGVLPAGLSAFTTLMMGAVAFHIGSKFNWTLHCWYGPGPYVILSLIHI